MMAQAELRRVKAALHDKLPTKWGTRCKLCKIRPASGYYFCEFTQTVAIKALCAACGMHKAYSTWTGFMGPKLHRLTLLRSLTFDDLEVK